MKQAKILAIFLGIFSTLGGQSIQADTLFWKLKLPQYAPVNQNGVGVNLKSQNTQIDRLKVYVSNITLWQDDSLVHRDSNYAHLLDLNEPASLKMPLSVNKNAVYNRIKFNLGIDSITNVAGVMGGDLDPSKGMYWTWQSGYINFKIEGSSDRCLSADHRFEFHVGGYQYPFLACKEVDLHVLRTQKLQICMDLNAFFNQMDWTQDSRIMSPSIKAVGIADKLSTCIYLE